MTFIFFLFAFFFVSFYEPDMFDLISVNDSGVDGVFGNPQAITLPWFCDFGQQLSQLDQCGFRPDDVYSSNFRPGYGETPTFGTGPPKSETVQRGTCKDLLKTVKSIFKIITCNNSLYSQFYS